MKLKDHKPELRKLAFFLPNLFTALNLGCGFFSILLVFQGKFYMSCMLIILGSIFDLVDGRVARMTGTQSSFGEQFDSLSDLVSFGLAPSLIFYSRYLEGYGRTGIVFSFLFCLCGSLRLARFNANIQKISSSHFQGMPIPGAALAIIGNVLFFLYFDLGENYQWFQFLYIFLFSFLMVSNIPFPSFKDSDWVRKHKRLSFFIIIILILLCVTQEEIMIFLVISLYTLSSIIYYGLNRSRTGGILDLEEDEEP